MIRQLNPHLAAYPSVYGHGFDADPPLSAILRAQASYLRPPFLRRLSYRLQHRRKSPQPYFLSETYLASVMDSTFPYLRQLFKIERIHDEDAFNRIATIEFLCQQYNAQAM